MKTRITGIAQIQKLKLEPGDILVAVVGVPASLPKLQRIHPAVKNLVQEHKVIVVSAGIKLEKLADLLTAEDLQHLSAALEKKLLATPAAPLQTPEK